jgi:hypothetical protein
MTTPDITAVSTDDWNRWRAENPDVLIDLRGAVLRSRKFAGALLHDVNLAGADLSACDLRGADLKRADLRGVLFTGADLRQADLRSAVLADIVGGVGNSMVDITDADFTEAIFGWTMVADIYLNRITGIGQVRHSGPSYLSTSTLEFTVAEIAKSGVIRTDVESFLRGAGVLLDSFKQFEQSLRSHAFYSVFISYSHADKNFATWLHGELESRGIRCWLDEKNMKAGERILNAVGKAISTHDRVLLCCSKSSLDSWWVQDEIRKVQEVERQPPQALRILPILLDQYLLGWNDGLASDLRSRLGLDFTKWNINRGSQAELTRLLDALTKA